jgi:hypothetical protein
VVAGLILIGLGVAALCATWLPGSGAWLFLGLGGAFLVARVLTGRSGYAVPAGILLGFGAFVLLTETGYIIGPEGGGVFFICLGLGFLASYAIAARPVAVWPILPGLALIGFGAFVEASTYGAAFAGFGWLAQFWPVVLVGVGAWLLVRERIPEQLRTPIAIVGTAVLILVGLLLAASAVATAGIPYARAPMPWPVGQVAFGTPPIQDTLTLSAPIDGLTSIRMVNTSGTTLVSTTASSQATVQVTRHFWNPSSPPEVRLVPAGDVLVVEAADNSGGYNDYVVSLPAAMGADVRSASGSVNVSGLSGPVHVVTSSGAIDVRDLRGATSVSSASGSIRMSNVAGDLTVSSTSGSIYGTGLSQVNSDRSTSGSINLTGDFASNAQIGSTSGSVTLGFTPNASVHIDAASLSGDVRVTGLRLMNQSTVPHGLSGDLGNGGPMVSVRTTSGGIRLIGGS